MASLLIQNEDLCAYSLQLFVQSFLLADCNLHDVPLLMLAEVEVTVVVLSCHRRSNPQL